MQEEEIQAIKEGFEAKYPQITMNYFFAGTNKVLTKLATEMQSGEISADLVWTGAPALVFLPAVRHLLAVESRAYELVMLWLDSIGLGLFTVVGVQCAFQQAQDYNLFLLVFVGVITGVGGGVLRDVLSNQKPYIFVKHFYACPTLIGALLCALCWRHLGDIPSMLLGAAVILVLRLCAAHFRWGLPHAADLPE